MSDVDPSSGGLFLQRATDQGGEAYLLVDIPATAVGHLDIDGDDMASAFEIAFSTPSKDAVAVIGAVAGGVAILEAAVRAIRSLAARSGDRVSKPSKVAEAARRACSTTGVKDLQISGLRRTERGTWRVSGTAGDGRRVSLLLSPDLDLVWLKVQEAASVP